MTSASTKTLKPTYTPTSPNLCLQHWLSNWTSSPGISWQSQGTSKVHPNFWCTFKILDIILNSHLFTTFYPSPVLLTLDMWARLTKPVRTVDNWKSLTTHFPISVLASQQSILHVAVKSKFSETNQITSLSWLKILYRSCIIFKLKPKLFTTAYKALHDLACAQLPIQLG